MKDGPDIASLAALIGDSARANMLCALMSGYALTAGELAREARITPQTASTHLSKLIDAGLLSVETQGRHRYHRIAGPDVAEAIEALTGLASRLGRLRTRPGPSDEALRQARFCYDHLAGEMGTALYDAFARQGLIVAAPNGIDLSAKGRDRFNAEGIDIEALAAKRRPLCRACLDWSTRRYHLAGSLGAAVMSLIIERGWARRKRGRRELVFSGRGQRAFDMFVGIGVAEKNSSTAFRGPPPPSFAW